MGTVWQTLVWGAGLDAVHDLSWQRAIAVAGSIGFVLFAVSLV